ncbi:uncharacterized protein [Antedon mediterranea]|uniref:uncharacterized protein n=1 Tax=Antedon mediterranea TaxID=105859 RepID=UPI003AF584DB
MSAPSTRPNTRSRRNIQQNTQESKVIPSPSPSKRRRGTSTSTTPTKSTNTVTSVSTKQAPLRTVAEVTKTSPKVQPTEEPVITETKSSSAQKIEAPASLPKVSVNPKLPFKNPQYLFDKTVGRRKNKGWKSLRQIVSAERAPGNQNQIAYGSIDAPPSFKPAKKYSDLSGLTAKYTDPQTKLRYSNTDEYSRIHLLPSDIVNGLLSLRKANVVVA